MAAKTDQSPGVLLASGYIAGATLAGVVFAFLNLKEGIVHRLSLFEEWSKVHNPFFEKGLELPFRIPGLGNTLGADFLGLIPFVILTVLLYIVGRELLLKPKAYVPKR